MNKPNKRSEDLSDHPLAFNEVKVSYSGKPTNVLITSSKDAYKYMLPFWEDMEYCESFYVLLLSRGNKVLGACRISIGSVAGCIADPKKIFHTALISNASAVILMHNHPSGTTTPSHNDNMVTKKCVEVGKFMELPVLDHVIMCKDKWFSFADEGLI